MLEAILNSNYLTFISHDAGAYAQILCLLMMNRNSNKKLKVVNIKSWTGVNILRKASTKVTA